MRVAAAAGSACAAPAAQLLGSARCAAALPIFAALITTVASFDLLIARVVTNTDGTPVSWETSIPARSSGSAALCAAGRVVGQSSRGPTPHPADVWLSRAS